MHSTEPALPQYRQLAKRLWDSIVLVGLKDGSRLPSVRALAAQHGVSLTTALQALRWLETQGNICARPRSGYFVARRAVRQTADVRTKWPDPLPELDAQARDHLAMVGSPCTVQLDLATGESCLYPADRFSVLLRRFANQQKNLVGSYVRGAGHPELRREIVRQAMQYPCDLDPDEVVLTNGCTEALNLALRAVTRPGDVVAVESPTYYVLLQILRSLELTALPVPCLPDAGMDLGALKDALGRVSVKAVVTIANGNNPVGSVASDSAKRALIELLRDKEVPLIEDDIFGDVCFGETRPRPVRAFDKNGNVLLCGGFSKSLCPGLRLGWIAAGRFTERVKALKYTTSMATAELQQVAVAEMLASGGYALHLRRLKAALQHQQKSLRDAILRDFPAGTEVSNPAGGFVLWVRLPRIDGYFVSTRHLFEQARREGIGFAPGHLFGQGDTYDDCLRVNAGYRWTSELEAAVERLGTLVVPGSAQFGNKNDVTVQAEFSYANAAPSLNASYSFHDVTTVDNTALSLSKVVRNITTGGAFGVNNQAKSGDVLEYQITYSNNAASAITNMTINDTTPAYTTFVSSTTGTTPATLTACMKNTPANPSPTPAVLCNAAQAAGGAGALNWRYSGSLSGGASG